MRLLRDWIARLLGSVRRRDVDARLEEEIAFHVDQHVERAVRDGASPEEARRKALVAFGGRESWREATRDEFRHRPVERAIQDARFAIRTLRRSPAFTAVALLTFAIGIGANTAVFSVVSGILLNPLPFAAPERLASIWPTRTISNAELEYLQANAKTFSAVGAFSPGWGITLTGSGEPRHLAAARVSTNFFQILGARPVVGRAFAPGESNPNQWNVAVLSHEVWTSQFGADPRVVGRIVQMDGTPVQIIGVMPASFEAFQADVDAWLPLQVDRSSRFYTGQTALGFGRLGPSATFETATAEVAALAPRMRSAFNYTEDYGRGGTVVSLHDMLVGNVKQSLFVLLGAATFVLLIAGANVGNLLLVHATARRRELAVRRALGASRGQVAQQMLVQSVIVALAGGAIGTLIGVFGVRGLKSILPSTLPMLAGVSVDWRVLVVTTVVTVVIGLVFGVAPALAATRVDPDGALRTTTTSGASRSGATTRRTLVIVETALAMVLVIGAGLMTETLWRLSRVDLGFDASGVLSFRLQPSSGQVASGQATTYFNGMISRLAAQPGVDRIGGVQHLPLTGFNWRANLDIEKEPIPETAEHPRVVWRSVVGDYFGAMRIPLKSGRLFLATDDNTAPPVAVINEAMAKRFWNGRDPIGERIRIGTGSRNGWVTIVGVVGNVRYASPNTDAGPEVYRPNAQVGLVFSHFVVRAKTGNAAALMPDLRTAIRSLDANVPIADVRVLGALYSAATATPRTIARLLLGFAGVGLLLAAIGIYGVIAYSVGQRTRELGIRTALGAIEGRIVSMIVGEGVRMALAGVVIGAVVALFAVRSLSTFVFGVTTTDARVYVAVALLLMGVSALAAYIPARRAARVDPLTALRSE